MRLLVRLFISVYRYSISPFLGERCRFYPSCSVYAHKAFSSFSFTKAFILTIKRLSKCHPLHPGGYDPVPETFYLFKPKHIKKGNSYEC